MCALQQPQTERARRSLERILSAVEELLVEKEFSEITVGEIADKAGVSTGLLYSRFDGKDEILPYLIKRFYRRVRDAMAEELSLKRAGQLDLDDRLERLIAFFSELASRDAGLVRAAAARRLLIPDVQDEVERSLNEELREHAFQWLRAGKGQVRRDDPDEALRFVHFTVLLVTQLVSVVEVDRDRRGAILEYLRVAMEGFLASPGPPVHSNVNT